jgi:hypothetical protein
MTNADRPGEIGRRRDALKPLCVDAEPSTLSLMSPLLERMNLAVTVLDGPLKALTRAQVRFDPRTRSTAPTATSRMGHAIAARSGLAISEPPMSTRIVP